MNKSDIQAQAIARAQQFVPRGVSSGHRVGWTQVFDRTAGSYVWDMEGNRYIDYLNAWGPIVLGHCDERVSEAVSRAIRTCDVTGVGPQLYEADVAEIVCGAMPSADKVAFCSSGTDATMHAAHIARAATGRRKLLKFHGSYHGWNDQLAVGSSRVDFSPDAPLNTPNGAGLHPGSVADVVVVEWNDHAGLKAAFAEFGPELAAAFSEPYVHSYGCVPAEPGFLELLRDLCTAEGTILVFDEVKTGFRAALGGYQSVIGVTPALTAFGKAIANGFSVAGVAGIESLMGHLGAYDGQKATLDGTYNASPYGMAASLATLRVLGDDETIPHLYAMGERLRAGLREAIAAAGVPACVAGLGSEYVVYFREQLPKNFKEAMDVDGDLFARYHAGLLRRGVLEPSFPTGDRRMNAAVTADDIDYTIEAATASLAEL